MRNTICLILITGLLSACATALIGGAIVTGVSVAHDRRSAGQVLDDRIIAASVSNQLRKDIQNDSRIKVKAYNGVVLLAGEVLSSNDKWAAEDAAAAKDGVFKVVNELKLVSDTSAFGTRAKDKYISSKAKGSLLDINIDGFDPTRVSVVTANHEVFLMGLVSHAEAHAVVEKIRRLKHVKRVIKVFEYTD